MTGFYDTGKMQDMRVVLSFNWGLRTSFTWARQELVQMEGEETRLQLRLGHLRVGGSMVPGC